MKVKKFKPLGAELTNFVFNNKTTEEELTKLKKIFLQNSVLILRGLDLNAKNLLSIARLWGKPQKHTNFSGIEGYPEIIKIQNYGKKFHTNDHWHSDVTFEEKPPDITFLYALEVPLKGGNTLFSNQYLAYEFLPIKIKNRLESFRAKHSNIRILKMMGQDSKKEKYASHPIFRIHPETNKKALYVTEAFVEGIEGMEEEESSRILKDLYLESSKTKYRFEHRWIKGDLVMWDNRCVQHYAIHDYGDETRNMYRITINI